jgi:hypothetical protein
MTRQERYRKRKPWVRFVEWARRRCKDKNSKWWPAYGSKGIECRITAKDLEVLWHECKAADMDRPSLDRIRSEGHYEIGNIRFLEFNLNSKRVNCPSWDAKEPE